ncbi:MFS transporter [Dactylosporangium sp. CA-139066]|uniref:MFS transporter n=1 Tax=Dactylosporangium sp. CA-139066 TaxID=3239930 RepID=UPI003D8DC1BF
MTGVQPPPGRRSPLAALAVRDYRYFMVAQVTGNCGMWMHRTAHVWLVVQLSGADGLAVGVVTSLQYLSMIVLSVGGGSLGDRFDKRRLMLVTQVASVLACLALALLIFRGLVTLPIAYVFAVLLGIPNAIDAPVRLAYPRQLVPREVLAPAVGLNGAVFQFARVVGPALAGGVLALLGTGQAFLVVAALGAVSCTALLGIRPPVRGNRVERGRVAGWRRTLRELRNPAYLVPLFGGLVLGIGMTNLQLVLPLLVHSSDSAARSFGVYLAMIGAGGVVGSALTSVVVSVPRNRHLHLWSAVFAAVTIVVALLPSGVWLAVALFVAGAVMQAFGTTAISALQLRGSADLQSKLMALYVIVFFVWAPLGAPLFGGLADLLGARSALTASGVLCLVLIGLSVVVLRRGRGPASSL